MVYKFFNKKLPLVVLKMKTFQTKNYRRNYTNQSLKSLIKKVDSHFIDNIWGADLADM